MFGNSSQSILAIWKRDWNLNAREKCHIKTLKGRSYVSLNILFITIKPKIRQNLVVLNMKQELALYVAIVILASCDGDSGAPIWLVDKRPKTIVGILDRGHGTCGYERGEKDIVTLLTHPEVNKWIKKYGGD